MTDKDKPEAQDKPKKTGRTTKSTTRKTTTTKTATRAKSSTAAKKSTTAKATKETKARTTRTRPRRVKPKSEETVEATEAIESAQAVVGASTVESSAPAESSALAESSSIAESSVPTVQELEAPVEAVAQPEPVEDPGATALAEWAAVGASDDRRRLANRGRGRPLRPSRPTGSAVTEKPAPRADSELLDIPAWPELSDDAPAAAASPAPRAEPQTPARADTKAAEPASKAAPRPTRQAPAQPAKSQEAGREPFRPVDQKEADVDSDFGAGLELESEAQAEPDAESEVEDQAVAEAPAGEPTTDEERPQKSRRRRRRRRGRHRKDQQGQDEPGEAQTSGQSSGSTAAPVQPEASADSSASSTNSPTSETALAAPLPADTEWDAELSEEELEPTTPVDEKNGRLMLINVAEGEECRIAILHQNRLEELFIERASAESHVGNIYKGRVTNVEPSIQAAFVDFGLPKNGFLHISDLQPQYFPGGMKTVEEVGRKTPRRDRPPIQKCLRRGQEIIVQIIKEGIGTKGPTLTTYISIPGRYLVMMPGMNRLGVSRRIEDEEARRKMRKVLEELNLPKDMGFILRTAGLDRTKRELQQDLLYLQRLWKVVERRIKTERAPCELYRESDLVIRTIRDVFSPDFSKILVDDAQTAEKVRDFLAIAMPRSSAPVEVYTGHRPLFHEYKLEQEIERINSRYVPLPSGGSLVIESTEALVAIDVNSGKYREHDDAEETAYRINLEAAEEIARQLRLRDLGGLILCDLIDMRLEKHRRGVERALREALKKHKERAKCLRMSQFGIIEMTRQRMRPSIKRSIYQDCPHCRGTGLVKNSESMTLDIMRLLRLATHHDQVDTVEVRVAPAVGFQLQNRKRAAIHALEQETGRRIIIRTDENLGPDQYSFECLDQRGGTVRIEDLPESARSMPEPRSKRRSGGGGSDARSNGNGRKTLEDVFD
ncbi:MAG TPA: Rne/Rng family ribonuclease [Phycisphaerae bacterium]|nr:Rne/Rng family ribonuclease [Phycisphaerae bacterium]